MRILYYDCFCGISAEKNLGALLDLGVDQEYFSNELAKLQPDFTFTIDIGKKQAGGICGTQADLIPLATKACSLPETAEIIRHSTLSDRVKEASLSMLQKAAQAEAKVQGKSLAEICCPAGMVGAAVGAAVCMEYLRVGQVVASPVQVGGGFVQREYGLVPVPAPATVEILRGIPLKFGLVSSEVTNPAGAAFLAANAEMFTDKIDLSVERTGYGFGKEDLQIPHVLRIFLGTKGSAREEDEERAEQYVLETNIDDMNPELYGYIEERLFASGALDVYKTAIGMKKGRLATKISILMPAKREREILDVIFRETTALGVRKYKVEKIMLHRDFTRVRTAYGEATVKNAYYQGSLVKYKPEYEDCKRIAAERKIPIVEVYREVYKKIEEQKRGK